MWVFLTRRLRTWLLLAIALPLARRLVHRLAANAERHDPNARRTRALRKADSAVSSVSRRASGRGRR
jgi:hypothetical protein